MKKKVMLIIGFLMMTSQDGYSDTTVADRVQKKLDQSTRIRQQTQKKHDVWEQERLVLKAKLEALTAQNNELTKNIASQKAEETSLTALNKTLSERKEKHLVIAKDIGPFTKALYQRLSDFIHNDAPFLFDERNERLKRLDAVMSAADVPVAEKFRKVMEALFIEAEYGNTIEVCQEQIELAGDRVMGSVLRLGRVSLFFLSQNQDAAARYHVGTSSWESLQASTVPAITAAIEMGETHRPLALLTLPPGRLTVKGHGIK